MTTLTFDTLAYVKTLRFARVDEQQADAQATALATVLKGHADDLATKGDIHDLKQDMALMKRDMDILKAELKRDLSETKADLIRWVVGIGFLQSALIIGILAKVAKVI